MLPVTEGFGGEARTFLVQIEQLRAIQEACGVGPAEIVTRLAVPVDLLRNNPKATVFELALQGLGTWSIDMVRAPILHGLVGGGLTMAQATRLVRQNIDMRGFVGLVEHTILAFTLVVAGVSQPAKEGELGEGQAGPTETRSH